MEKPEIPQKAPYAVECDPGTYRWCTCGLAKTQPFCDDSHYGTGFEPEIVEITEKKTYYWCGCKHSENKPFCNGTHRKI